MNVWMWRMQEAAANKEPMMLEKDWWKVQYVKLEPVDGRAMSIELLKRKLGYRYTVTDVTAEFEAVKEQLGTDLKEQDDGKEQI